MIKLDTDHLSELRFPESQKHATLRNRMERATGERFATTIVNVEEQMRGWLAFIKRSKDIKGKSRLMNGWQKCLSFLRNGK